MIDHEIDTTHYLAIQALKIIMDKIDFRLPVLYNSSFNYDVIIKNGRNEFFFLLNDKGKLIYDGFCSEAD